MRSQKPESPTPMRNTLIALLLVPLLEAPAHCGQSSSAWVTNKFETYQSHPDWISTRCSNMQKVNGRGFSNYSEMIAELEKQRNPNFRNQTTKEILEFYRLFGAKFCPEAW